MLPKKIRRRTAQRGAGTTFIVVVILAVLMILSVLYCGNAGGKSVTETYIVKPNDTLWQIASQYVDKNTCGARDVREFYWGIIENNYELFKDRAPRRDIYPGDKLEIVYFVKEDK